MPVLAILRSPWWLAITPSTQSIKYYIRQLASQREREQKASGMLSKEWMVLWR